MARNINRNANNNVSTSSNFRKADGFLNLELTLASGATKKIGAIPLHVEKEIHALMIKYADRLEDMSISMNLHVVEDEVSLEDELFGKPAEVSNDELKQAMAKA